MATISVIIPLYNKREKIRRTIQSVLSQTYKDFEVIIINDGSSDDSLSAIQDISDPRISIYNQINLGVSTSRNLGIEKAKGQFIVFLDADDEWHPDYLMSMIKLANNYPDCNLFSSFYKFRDNNGREFTAKIRGLKIDNNSGNIEIYFKVASNSHPPLCIGNTMIRRSVLSDRTYYFDENVHHGEDLIFWAKLAAKHKIAFSKDILMTYNISSFPPGNDSKHIPNERDILYETLLVINSEFHSRYLFAYVAQCKKMLVATLTRRGLHTRAIKEALLGLRYNPLKWKLYLYILLNFIRIPNGKLDAILRLWYLKCS